jgi:putative ABC transport system permease protein
MDAFLRDIAFAFRVLFKRPGLTLLALVALAISMGMAIGTFSQYNAIFFKPLPFEDPSALYHIYLKEEAAPKPLPIPLSRVAEIEQLSALSDLIFYYSGTINVSGDGQPRRYDGAFVEPGFLEFLGHAPILGETFSREGKSAEALPEFLISHTVWQERFAGNPDIIGRELRVNGATHRLAGVLPEGFHYPINADVWVTVDSQTHSVVSGEELFVVALGRLADGIMPDELQNQLDRLGREWEAGETESAFPNTLISVPMSRSYWNDDGDLASISTLAVLMILLVSCANVANLLIGRALGRGREIAIRSAVGANRTRIMRQLLTESLLLCLIGSVGGLLYSAWAIDFSMQKQSFLTLPYWVDFSADWRVFLFTFCIILITTLASGFLPAWQASKANLNEMLKETTHTATNFRLSKFTRLLTVGQVAFSCALLFAAGLSLRNLNQMTSIDPGFDASSVLTMRMGLLGDYPEESDKDAFFEDLINAVDALPAAHAASVTSWISEYGNMKKPVVLPELDAPAESVQYAYVESISGGHFETLDVPLLSGRAFSTTDTPSSEAVAIVSQAFIDLYYPGEDVLGKKVGVFAETEGDEPYEFRRIVGIAPTLTVSEFNDASATEATVYIPYTQVPSSFMTLMVRSPEAGSDDLEASIKQAILHLDPHMPVYFVRTIQDYIDMRMAPWLIIAYFFLLVGLMSLFLAAVSVYGMIAFNVERRRKELGIRMALGANRRSIVSNVMQQGMVQIVLGIIIGTGLAFLTGSLSRAFLTGVNPFDPGVYLGVIITLFAIAAISFFVPARRVARLSPLDALRYE